ncbi:MAG: sortase, partial [Anaerolineales bacterium]|nr:sortase [Anaerolineales bacterium]
SASADGTTSNLDSATAHATLNPALTLVKGYVGYGDNDTSGGITEGDDLNYTLTMTNTGNTTLTNVEVSDPDLTPTSQTCASVAPGATCELAGSYTVTQADVDAGSFTNTGVVTDDDVCPAAGVGTCEDDVTTPILQSPAIAIDKNPPTQTVVSGSNVNFTLTVTNPGNVTLSNIVLHDPTCDTLTGPVGDLNSNGELETSETWMYACTVNNALADFTNNADVTGTPPIGPDVTDSDSADVVVAQDPVVGVAKRVVGTPVLVSAGTWDVTYQILVRNYGNVALSDLQVTDDLVATFPPATTFVVQSVTPSANLTSNLSYDGNTDGGIHPTHINLLAGTDSLAINASGTLTVVVRVVPAAAGPFWNWAIASGQPPVGPRVDDLSQDGADPDPDGDGNPTNNDDPTPVSFGPHLFDPPFGIKLLDANNLPVLRWTMVWINDTNIVAVNALASDGIPEGTTFVDNGIPSGYPLPPGVQPFGTVASGVTCEDISAVTITQYCYYEGPTVTYPRGRIVWGGTLGPDFGVTDPAVAVNAIAITFFVRVDAGVGEVNNMATIDSDRNGDGDTADAGEQIVARASAHWETAPTQLPGTGFAPGQITDLSDLEPVTYAATDEVRLEIPALRIDIPIVGVPLEGGDWDVTWLANQAGWLEGTAFPSWEGNSVLTGHVYLPSGAPGPFVNLGQLRWGDQIVVHAYGSRYVYEVRSNQVVRPNDLTALRHEDLPWVTLITCRQYDDATNAYRYRVVVRAVLLRVDPER